MAKNPNCKSYKPEYYTWGAIKQRCTNPKHYNYKNYGGRGITMCKEWFDSFDAFYRDMGDRPSNKHSIERINNEKGYEPSNCKWATKYEQQNNRRIGNLIATNKTGYAGVSFRKRYKNPYIAQFREKYLGCFPTPELAYEAYLNAIERYKNGKI